MKEQEMILFRESMVDSIVSDTFSFITIAAAIGLGVYLESSAMQWTGAILFFITMFSKGAVKKIRKTPQEAADYIRDTFGVTASDSEN